MHRALFLIASKKAFRTQQTSAMRFFTSRLTTTAAVVTAATSSLYSLSMIPTTQAWMASSPTILSGQTRFARSSRYSTSPISLHSAVAPLAEVPTSSGSSLGSLLAEGSIVARYAGGLTAIRIHEDDYVEAVTKLSIDLKVPDIIGAEAAGAVNSKKGSKSTASPSTANADLVGKHVVFPDGSAGFVVAHRAPVVFVYSDSGVGEMADGHAKIYSNMENVSVDPAATLVDCCGRSLTESSEIPGETDGLLSRAIFAPIPQLKDIALINNPMLTGVTMMDVLAPIGRGQNMLMVGHNASDLRGYALDFVHAQIANNQTKCVYACNQEEEVAGLLKRFKDMDMDHVHVVAPRTNGNSKDISSKSAEAVCIAATACAIGEAYAFQGEHAVVVIDTIDPLKTFWDATTRVLVDVFGVDAVVQADREGGASSEMRGFYSSLIQRSGQYKENRGGGSVTLVLLTTIPPSNADTGAVFDESSFENSNAKVKERIKMMVDRKIPLTAEVLRKVGIPIPSDAEGKRRLVLQHVDDLISMSDGQIWLDERLEATGQQPPMDPQRSVTRIGIGADTTSRADAPAIQRVAQGLRLDLSQAANMDGAEATTASAKQQKRQLALLLAMHQRAGSGGRRLSESCAALLAASEGYLAEAVGEGAALAGTEKGEAVMQELLEHVCATVPEVMNEIDQSLDMTPSTRKALTDAIGSFFA